MGSTLQTLLKILVPFELKQSSIGQSIVQAARPKSVITPTLGVEMDHVFGSKWFINELSQLGFSISYDKVNRYKQSMIQTESLQDMVTISPRQFHSVGSRHNISILNGEGTFHDMEIIAVSASKMTPSLPPPMYKPVLKLQHPYTLP